MTTEEKILHFKDTTDTFVAQLDKIIQIKGTGLSNFILTACLIDTLSYYTVDEKLNGDRYKTFITKYLAKSNIKYADENTARLIYESIRCSLVHSFTIQTGVILCEEMKDKHLTNDFHKNLIIDLEQFYFDIRKTLKDVYRHIDTNAIIQKIFKKRYQKCPPFEVYKTVEMFDGKTFAVTGTISLPVKSYKVINYGQRKNKS